MSRKMGRTLSHEWDALTKQAERGKPWSKALPTVLPLGSIKLRPAIFQHRGHGGHEGKTHIRKLADAISRSRSRSLDPVMIWWDGKGWVCVDGHHRHAAYQMAGVGTAHPVPVSVFEGSLAQAMTAAASGNSKDKLSMTSADKSNAAWRLVVVTDMSKAEVSRAVGVSESTVASMRRVHGLLDARAGIGSDDLTMLPCGDHRNLRWAEAKRLADGRAAVDFDWEEADEKRAQSMALAIRRALGDEGGKRPDIMARALEIYDGRLPDQLAEVWGNQEGDADD